MTECTDPTAKVSERVLGCEVGHNWVVIEWEYVYDNSGSTSSYPANNEIRSYIPLRKYKKAIRKMCSRCGKIESI